MQFNRRTAPLMSKWFGALGVLEVCERALQAARANAWRERERERASATPEDQTPTTLWNMSALFEDGMSGAP